MLKVEEPTTVEKRLAGRARELAKSNQVLYHGTRHVNELLRSGKLSPSSVSDAVALTRSPEVAAYFALMPGRAVDNYSGAILVLDRNSLRQVYTVEPFHDPCWDKDDHRYDEQEERIVGRIVSFRRHLIGVIRAADLHVAPGINPATGTADTPRDAVKKAQRNEVLAFRVPADSLLFSEEYGLAGGGWD